MAANIYQRAPAAPYPTLFTTAYPPVVRRLRRQNSFTNGTITTSPPKGPDCAVRIRPDQMSMEPADTAILCRTSTDSKHAVPLGRTEAVWRRQQSRHVIVIMAWAISAACRQPSRPRPVGRLWEFRVGLEVLSSWKITSDLDIRLGQLSEGLVSGRLPEATSNRHQRATPTV